jgi:heat shock protein HslJ
MRKNPQFRIPLMTTVLLALGACVARPGGTPDSAAGEARNVSPAPSALTDARWALVELEGAPALARSGQAMGMDDPYLALTADSARVGGSTGCNSFGGAYELSGDRLSFSRLFSTKRACVEAERSRQEARFVAALEATERYEIVNDTLTLFQGERALARFVPRRDER